MRFAQYLEKYKIRNVKKIQIYYKLKNKNNGNF